MTLYEFISKFVNERVKVVHSVQGKPLEMVFEGWSGDFMARFDSKHRISRSHYYNAYVSDHKLIVVFQYNREVKEDVK